MRCLFPYWCAPRKSDQVKRVLADMANPPAVPNPQRQAEDAMQVACDEALRALTARLRRTRLRKSA